MCSFPDLESSKKLLAEQEQANREKQGMQHLTKRTGQYNNHICVQIWRFCHKHAVTHKTRSKESLHACQFAAANLRLTSSAGQPSTKKTEGRPLTQVFEELRSEGNVVSPPVKRRRLVRLKQGKGGSEQQVGLLGKFFLCLYWAQVRKT